MRAALPRCSCSWARRSPPCQPASMHKKKTVGERKTRLCLPRPPSKGAHARVACHAGHVRAMCQGVPTGVGHVQPTPWFDFSVLLVWREDDLGLGAQSVQKPGNSSSSSGAGQTHGRHAYDRPAARAQIERRRAWPTTSRPSQSEESQFCQLPFRPRHGRRFCPARNLLLGQRRAMRTRTTRRAETVPCVLPHSPSCR